LFSEVSGMIKTHTHTCVQTHATATIKCYKRSRSFGVKRRLATDAICWRHLWCNEKA